MDENENKKEERKRNNRKMLSKLFLVLGALLAIYTTASCIRGQLSVMYAVLMAGIALVFIGLGLLSGAE